MSEAASHDANEAGLEHVLLALCDSQGIVAEVLREVGITRELIERRYPELAAGASTVAAAEPRKREAGLRGDGERIYGVALGLATAWGETSSPTHYLLAITYHFESVFPSLGTTSVAVVDALRRRGVHVPDAEPPVYQAWRGTRDIEVSEEELQPLLDVLRRRHPPGSEWRWGLGSTDADDYPRHVRVSAEEGIDLEAALRESRGETE
jgi:hypothetical protein